jgi:hypothetical protein
MGVPIYNTSNLKSIWLIVAGIALSILLINTALSLVTAAYPNWLPRQFFGVDFIADNRQRARAAIRQLNDGTIRQNETFVLILGLSSASEGISLATVSEDTIDQHFLALTGGGRNMTDTARYARTLLKSSATPDLTVLAINPFHLMDPPPPSEAIL